MTTNPYQSKHRCDERVFSEHLPASATNQMVDHEYGHLTRREAAGVPHERCEAGLGTFFYKATVGVFKCTACGTLARVVWEDDDETPYIEEI